MKVMIGAACVALATAAQPAMAQDAVETGPQSMFKIEDVDRDNVKAGTPAGFYAAFKDAERNEATRKVDDTNYTFVPLAYIPLPDGKTALISTGASECTGHVCSGINSVHYLEGSISNYKVTGEWLNIGTGGTYGNAALSWGWSDAIASSPVLYTDGGGTWQGYSCSYASLTELTPKGPVELANFPVYYSNSGATETGVMEVKGAVTSAEKDRSFTVSYSGLPKTVNEKYVRGKDGKYESVGKSKVPTC